MNLNDISNKVNTLANTWEQFKSINERRINEVETKGNADPVTVSHLQRINSKIDKYQETLDGVEAVLNRPHSEKESKNYSDCYEYKDAFCNYVRKGMESELSHLEQKNLTNSNDKELGYSVTNQMNEDIDGILSANSPMRQIANVMNISSDALELIEDREDITSGWSQDSINNMENTKETAFSKKSIIVHELYAQPKVTQKLIDDPRIDVEKWLSKKLSNIFTRQENIAFINGDGIGKPKGILSYEDGVEYGKIERVKAVDGKLQADDLIKLFFSIKEIYADNTQFLVSREALQEIRMLKDNNGQYLWQPNLSEHGASNLFGVEIKVSTDMPNISVGNIPIAFGNFKTAYQIVDRNSIRILRDPFTHKPYVKFYSTKRVGGDVVNFDAIKLLEIAS
ncbi:MAG: HK97 family phage major capsid protein [Candidatus Midichloriaceae bacterium]|jgi:HK97 family phage major capsid protein